MSHEIFMPALSSTMTEGKIVEWLKNPGDKVERGESVLVVESDKADMDVESFQDGYLAAVLMPAGSTAPVGETIGIIVENLLVYFFSSSSMLAKFSEKIWILSSLSSNMSIELKKCSLYEIQLTSSIILSDEPVIDRYESFSSSKP